MKKNVALAWITILLVSCGLSNEKKANRLIQQETKKTLLLADSYEPVETQLDSAFAPYDSPELYEKALALYQCGVEITTAKEEAKDTKSKMAIWSDGFSAAARNEYDEAKNAYDEAIEKERIAQLKGEGLGYEIRELLQAKPTFIGYKATHTYRAKNNAGFVMMGHDFFLFDKDIQKVIAKHNMDGLEYEMAQAIIKKFKERIE